MKKINIAELLKDCPKGTKLYSTVHGYMKLIDIYRDAIRCKPDYLDVIISFNSNGRWVKNQGECILFPSKENRDWSTFQRPFKDGDIITCTNSNCTFVAIYKDMYDEYSFNRYVCLILNEGMRFSPDCTCSDFANPRFATEEEKQKLFDVIKANGYKWNPETKTLEKLVNHKFKIGDRVKKNKDAISGIVTDIFDDSFKVTYDSGACSYVQFHYEYEWELVPPTPKFKEGDRVKHIPSCKSGIVVKVDDKGYYIDYPKGNGVCCISFTLEKDYELLPNKFDITTLKPFESRVLVRDYNTHIWEPVFWGKLLDEKNPNLRYLTTNGCFKYCIPYEGNQHLLGITNDCDNYYKTWK